MEESSMCSVELYFGLITFLIIVITQLIVLFFNKET